VRKIKILGLLFAGMTLVAAPVQAAVLYQTGGLDTTIADNIDSGFDSVGTGLLATNSVWYFDSSNSPDFGLFLSDAAKVTFQFLGREASFLNTFNVGANIFTNGTTSPGTEFSVDLAAGAIPFTFTSLGTGKTAVNNGSIESPLAFAIAVLDSKSAILLFDDGGAGIDLDDLAVKVTVSQVPLPAAAWLLISAILGMVSFARVRRAGANSA